MNVKIIDGFPQNLKEPLTGVRWTSPVRKSRKNNTMHLSKSAPCRTHSQFFSLWNRPSSLGGDKSSWSVPNLVGFRSFGNISITDHISLSPSTAWAHRVPRAPTLFLHLNNTERLIIMLAMDWYSLLSHLRWLKPKTLSFPWRYGR